ncbi:MAG: DUF4349 domain-containing protein [Myxococcota bacterium]
MIALLSMCAAFAVDDAPPPTRVSASVVVAVAKRDLAADALVERANELGGWFQSRNDEGLSLRVPSVNVDALLDSASATGKVLGRSVERRDVGQEMADLSGRLEARESVLKQYFDLLARAGADSIVTVERQIVKAIDEIERLKGRLQLLEDQSTFGRVDVAFQFRDRGAPDRDGQSSWGWINTLNVQDVIVGHQMNKPDWRSRGVSLDEAPEGFSPWKKQRRYRAASPDNVLFRMRAVKQKPKASLDFWQEAMRTRMESAGYRVIDEQRISANGTDGAMLELAAPLGTQDWSYLIAMFPRGGRIVLMEAAGEVTHFAPRRDAIVAAVERVDL